MTASMPGNPLYGRAFPTRIEPRRAREAAATTTARMQPCDLVFLFDRLPAEAVDACFNHLSQHMRNPRYRLTRAIRKESRLDLTVNGTRWLIEATNPQTIRPLFRPAFHGASRPQPHLTASVEQSTAALRFRVGAGGNDQHLSDCLELLFQHCKPVAVILMDQKTTLTMDEFQALSLPGLHRLVPGKTLIAPRGRPSVFATPPRSIPTLLSGEAGPGLDGSQDICAALAAQFRDTPRWSWISGSLPGRARIGILAGKTGPVLLDRLQAVTGTIKINAPKPQPRRAGDRA